jgi:hypothetical protein
VCNLSRKTSSFMVRLMYWKWNHAGNARRFAHLVSGTCPKKNGEAEV